MKTNWENNSHRRVLTEFIKIYRSEPCLWMTKSTEYRDRQLKEAAYERLSEKLREIDSTADREKVVKKINSLRTNYRKERKKIEERSDKADYQPRLWYYHMFDFLEGHELPGPNPFDTNDSQDTFEDYDDYESDPLTEIYNELDDFEAEFPDRDPTEQQQQQQQDCKPPVERLRNSPQSFAGSTRRLLTPIQKKTVQKRLHSNVSSDEGDDDSLTPIKDGVRKKIRKKDDRYDMFANVIAMKLRSLSDKKQRILAEKAINDALFMAELGELTIEHVTAPLNLNVKHSDVEFINSSTNQMDATVENENTGIRVVYPSGSRF